MFKLICKKIIAILRLKNLFNWPYVFRLLHIFKCTPESFTMEANTISSDQIFFFCLYTLFSPSLIRLPQFGFILFAMWAIQKNSRRVAEDIYREWLVKGDGI